MSSHESNPNYYLYLWPYKDRLEALQLSDNTTNQPGPNLVSTSGTSVSGVACSSGACPSCTDGTCFNYHVMAGDTITVGSQTRTVTHVNSETSLTVGILGFEPDMTGASWGYAGYFINPSFDVYPPDSGVGAWGGSIALTSNAGSHGLVWSIVADPVASPFTRSAGRLSAYNAKPTSGALTRLYYGPDNTFCAAVFALPTVAHGRVYVPTFALPNSHNPPEACPDSSVGTSPSGFVVYGLQ